MESLFSLEVFIKDIEGLSIDCGIPAVAFRFLDYPTLLVYCTDLKNIEDIEKKIRSIVMNETEAMKFLTELRNDSNGYNINKGKSCLFQKSFLNLQEALAQVPLYITLVDCLDPRKLKKQPKLLGVCSVSLLPLTKIIEEIKRKSFEDSPAIAYESHRISICNLMGTRIGGLNFTVKLTCFGSSLLKHVTVEDKHESHINILLKNLTLNDSPPDNKIETRNTPSPILEQIPADGVKELLPQPKMKDNFCQVSTAYSKRKVERKHFKTDETEAHEHDNTFCPPPLYLNLHPDEHHNIENIKNSENIKEKSRFITETNFHEFDSDFSSDEDPVFEKLIPINKHLYQLQSNEPEQILPDSRKIESVEKYENEPPHQTKDIFGLKKSMPMLCSLISEIARFNDILNSDREEVKAPGRTEKCICGDESKKKIHRTSSLLGERVSVDLNISSHMKSHMRNDEDFDGSLYKDDPSRKHDAVQVVSRKLKQQERKVKKRTSKLIYGLTRTQRMRYAMTHDGEEPSTRENKGEPELNVDVNNILVSQTAKPDETSPRNEETEEKRTVVEIGIQTSLEKVSPLPQQATVGRKQTESAIGFYSSYEPREITVSDLFDDNRPWSSMSTNRIPPFQPSAKQSQEFDSRASGYTDDSFATGSAISATSSISLPPVSRLSDGSSPQMKRDETFKTPSAVSLAESTKRTSHSKISNHTLRSSNISGRSSRRSSRESSINQSMSTNSIRSRDSYRNSPDIPKQSARSPLKSNYKRGNTEEQKKNVLNVTLPGVDLIGETSNKTNINSDD